MSLGLFEIDFENDFDWQRMAMSFHSLFAYIKYIKYKGARSF